MNDTSDLADPAPPAGEHDGGIRILLAYQGALLRSALAAALTGHGSFTVIADVSPTSELVDLARQYQPDIVVLDGTPAGTTPVNELCRSLQDRWPVLLLLDHRAYVRYGRALAQFAPRVGMISTDATIEELLSNIRRLMHGAPVVDARLATISPRLSGLVLTKREHDVLQLASQGVSTKEIAEALFLSVGTVRNYTSRILAKTGARNLVEAIRIGRDAGWV